MMSGYIGVMMRLFYYNFDQRSTLCSTIFGLLASCVVVSGLCVIAFLLYTSFTVDSSSDFSLENYRDFWQNDFYAYTFLRSFGVIFASLILMVVLALLIGRMLLFFPRKMQILFVFFFATPICFPSLVSVVALQRFLETLALMPQQGGPVNLVMFFGYTYSYFPYVFLLIIPTFLRVSRPHVEAARDLGCKELGLWWNVFLPFVRKSIYVSVISVFPFIFFDITVPEVFGGGKGGSFCHFLWTLFFEFHEWRNVSVIAIIFLLGCIMVHVFLRLVRDVKKKP